MSYNDIRATEPPYPTPINQDDYDALAARLETQENIAANLRTDFRECALRAERAEARLAEAEHLILRMAGEDYQRARFYVEKYDLTGERAAVSASVVTESK